MQKPIDQIGNFRGFTPSTPWPSWKRGQEKRDRMMEFLRDNPDASIEALALHCKISPVQVRRHKRNLIASGLWKVAGCVLIFASTFSAGAYYASSESVDEFIEERVKSPIASAQEDFLWNLEQTFL
jgi:DeoR/GlpR family transcriptional regulator of sugar metabolism